MNKKINIIIATTSTILAAIIFICIFSKKDVNEVELEISSPLVDEFLDENLNGSSIADTISEKESENSSESTEANNNFSSNNTDLPSESRIEKSSTDQTLKEKTKNNTSNQGSTNTQVFQSIKSSVIKNNPYENPPQYSSDDKIDNAVNSSNESVSKNSRSSNTSDSPTIEISSEGEKIYKDFVGNLHNKINNSDRMNLYSIINKITDSISDQEYTSNLYRQLIENLDQLTLKNYSQNELNYYKTFFANNSAAQGNIVISDFSNKSKIFPAVSSDGNTNTQNDDIKILDQYRILHNGNVSGANKSDYQDMWENVKKIIPFDLIKEIKLFIPFESPSYNGHSIYGFMQPLDWDSVPYQWALGVKAETDPTILPYILVHEYGHFISLKDTNVPVTKNNISKATDILKTFSSQCLGYISKELEMIDEKNQYLFYARHKNDFITMYASTNLMEDFAESFARFVTDSLSGSERFNLKNSYFQNNSYFSEIKSKILNNIKNNGSFNLINATR